MLKLLEETIYTYSLCDPDYGEYFYIGQSNFPMRRLEQHVLQATRGLILGHSTAKDKWIRGLLEQGKRPLTFIIEGVAASQADNSERKWIDLSRNNGYLLTNSTDGGSGKYNAPDKIRIPGDLTEMVSTEDVAYRIGVSLELVYRAIWLFSMPSFTHVETGERWINIRKLPDLEARSYQLRKEFSNPAKLEWFLQY